MPWPHCDCGQKGLPYKSSLEMPALTFKQPWASLIAYGIKDIENRSWKTNFRGRTYIHAGASSAFGNLGLGLNADQLEKVANYNLNQFDGIRGKNLLLSSHDTWGYSRIIGEVDIIDCVRDHNSIWAISDQWHWVLANAVVYEFPRAFKGQQGFWYPYGKP